MVIFTNTVRERHGHIGMSSVNSHEVYEWTEALLLWGQDKWGLLLGALPKLPAHGVKPRSGWLCWGNAEADGTWGASNLSSSDSVMAWTYFSNFKKSSPNMRPLVYIPLPSVCNHPQSSWECICSIIQIAIKQNYPQYQTLCYMSCNGTLNELWNTDHSYLNLVVKLGVFCFFFLIYYYYFLSTYHPLIHSIFH